uniref:Uncharacterized protein n=1 Tax=Anopheles maculatus TaxID=74869 RepID=A0A182SDN8_9DIPT
MNALKAKGREVRAVVVVEDSAPPTAAVRPPIPAPRTVQRQSDRNNNSRRQALPQMEQRAGNPKPVPRSRREYAEVKVRIGSAEAEESLYDSNEVVQNALKFDSRFRKVEFGSQDDIDSIAERTEDGSDQPVVTGDETVEIENRPVVRELKVAKQQISPRKQQPTDDQVRKTTFAEDVKKSFSNTVKSADFRKYLQSKGLSLVPAKSKAIEAARSKPQQQEKVAQRLSGVPVSSSPTSTRQQIKPSVLTRFFQNGLFAPKTPNDPAYSSAYGRSSTPVLFSTQARPGRPKPPARFGSFNGGSSLNKSSAIVADSAPLYSEPLREAAPMMVPDETDSGFRSALDNGYHIYEQTPDNLRRGELVYGKIGYLSNTQLNRWHPQDRRSFSSMQEGGNVTGMNGGTYGRLRPLYVSSPLSTQSTPVRRGSDTIDREQILHRIYDFCRRSIRNSSRTSVHSNQTEPPLYHHSSGVVQGPAKIVPA